MKNQKSSSNHFLIVQLTRHIPTITTDILSQCFLQELRVDGSMLPGYSQKCSDNSILQTSASAVCPSLVQCHCCTDKQQNGSGIKGIFHCTLSTHSINRCQPVRHTHTPPGGEEQS